MLVLTRRKGKEVQITLGGESIWIKVIDVQRNGSVKLGFEAAAGVDIVRGELTPAGREREAASARGLPGES